MTTSDNPPWLEEVQWDSNGLVPAIAQDIDTGKVLTLAWMNQEALCLTAQEGQAVYWSRSRQKIWRKGEESGHTQEVHDIYLDCDKDTILLKVNQTGGIACHTGRHSCFYHRLDENNWVEAEPIIKDPAEIYADD